MAKKNKKRKATGERADAEVNAAASVDPREPSSSNQDWIWGLALLFIVGLAYQPVWYAGFIWDDDINVTSNPYIVSLPGLAAIWTSRAADICPLTHTTFWFEHAMWGPAPLPYHLVNVFMHGISAILLWRVLRCLQIPGAWLGAALWAVHPVEGESVAWITELKNTQSALFFLLSILFFTRWLRPKDLGAHRSIEWNYPLSLIFAALAMASKSSTVILPVVLCLCAWWIEGRWNWRNLARVIPIFLMSVASGALSVWTQGLQLAIAPDPHWDRSWPQRIAAAGDAVWFYLGKLIWPYPLMTVYPRWQIDASQALSYLPLLAVIAVLLLLWWKRESWAHGWFFAYAYFLVALLPGLGLIDNSIFRYSLVFDHLQYLASMGPLALAGAGMVRLADGAIPGNRWLQAILGAGVIALLGVVTWQRTWVYESQETLWADEMTKNQDCWLGHNNLGVALRRKGKVDEAVAHFQRTLEINPNYADAHSNFGNALLQMGQVDEAIFHYQRALAINPDFAEAHYNLGIALSQKGRQAEAIAEFHKTLAVNPNIAEAHCNLGNALLLSGRVDEAISEFQRALVINPNYANAHNNLGNALLHKGQVDEAMAQFEKALEFNPNLSDAYYNLGNAYLGKGRLDDATTEFQKALELDPKMPETHNNLGIILAKKGRFAEAVAQFQEALRLNPHYIDAQINLTKVTSMSPHKQNR